MALIFPTTGNGNASFASYVVASSADFRIEVDQIKMPDPVAGTGVIIGNSTSTGFFIASTSSQKVYFKLSNIKNIIPAETIAAGATLNNLVISRVSNVITMSADEITTVVETTDTFSGFTFNNYGTANGGSQFKGAIAGGIRFYDSAGTLAIDHNFDQAISATVIPDATVSPSDATLSGFAQAGSGFDGNVLNAPPVANAGPDQSGISQGATVTLDGTGSSDDVGITAYSWAQTGGPSVGTITNASTATATFTAPNSAGTYTFTLTVTDADGLTHTDDVIITVDEGSPEITITSPSANTRVHQRNIETNSYDFTFTGDIQALPVGATVQYSYDNTNWSTLDATPTEGVGGYTGTVTVTSTQEVFIRLLDGVTAYAGGSIVCAAVAVVGGAGQSNMGSRITNNQPVVLDVGAKTPLLMRENDYAVTDLADPTGRPGQNPANQGSLGPGLCSALANANPSITYLWINYSQGGTGILAHTNPSAQWTRQAAFASRLGGIEINFLLIGETDMGTGNENQAFYELRYGEYVDDVFNAYGIGTYIIGVPKANYSTDAEYRAGIASVISTNENAYDGGDLRPLDLANTGGDGTHITTNTQATQAVDIIFAAYQANNDTTIPVITLLGTTPVTVTQNTTYTDAGATASDNIDGDITADIVTVSNVNTSVVGAYSVTYNVDDAAGNSAAQVTRVVNVQSGGTSTASITITGIPDGSHAVKIRADSVDGAEGVLFNGDLTFTGGSASTTVAATVGTVFTGRYLGANPPTTGTGIYGVTV